MADNFFTACYLLFGKDLVKCKPRDLGQCVDDYAIIIGISFRERRALDEEEAGQDLIDTTGCVLSNA